MKRHKYGVGAQARRTVDGIVFASIREATRYSELCLLQAAGQISGLTLQPRFELVVGTVLIAHYIADFTYRDTRTGQQVVEDAKGVRTPVYKLKKKLMKALHQIDITEV